MFDAGRPEVFQPREGRVVGLVALGGGVVAHVVRNEPLHQRIAVVRKHLPGEPSGPAVEPQGGVAGDVALKTEQQRIGRLDETLVHAAAQNPQLG